VRDGRPRHVGGERPGEKPGGEMDGVRTSATRTHGPPQAPTIRDRDLKFQALRRIAVETSSLIGFVLIGVGVADFAVGHLVVVPKVKAEDAKPKLRLAFTVASLLTIGLGTSFLLGWIGRAS